MVAQERRFCPNCFGGNCTEEGCLDCGFLWKQDIRGSLALPAGTVLRERYEVGAVLGTGGFGITYKVRDRKSGQIRAMKEFVPDGTAKRRPDGLTLEALEGKRREYETGLERFTTERQILRKLKDHPGVVDIVDSFGANGTEYFLMEYLKGRTFGQALKTIDRKACREQITGVVAETGRIMGEIHRSRKILHRDISPENIYLQEGPLRVRLIDFGSAEWIGSGKSRHFSMVLKRGFAPPEQYSSHMPQGSYTDVYALAGTYYYALTGILIPSALDRSKGAVYTPLKDMGAGIGERASKAVDQALIMDFRLRTQTMEQFLDGIREEGPARVSGSLAAAAALRGRGGGLLPQEKSQSRGHVSGKPQKKTPQEDQAPAKEGEAAPKAGTGEGAGFGPLSRLVQEKLHVLKQTAKRWEQAGESGTEEEPEDGKAPGSEEGRREPSKEEPSAPPEPEAKKRPGSAAGPELKEDGPLSARIKQAARDSGKIQPPKAGEPGAGLSQPAGRHTQSRLGGKPLGRADGAGRAQAPPVPYISLQVKGARPSARVLRPGEELRIGRGEGECGLVIQRPEISKLHCILYYDLQERLFFIKDKSTNGVFLENGRGGFLRLQRDRWYRMGPGTAAMLATGDCKIKVGING